VCELRLRDPQKLCLTTGNLTVELRIAEERRARALVANLGRLTLRVELPFRVDVGSAKETQERPLHRPISTTPVAPAQDQLHETLTALLFPRGRWTRSAPLARVL
jgi:hypothetical protein